MIRRRYIALIILMSFCLMISGCSVVPLSTGDQISTPAAFETTTAETAPPADETASPPTASPTLETDAETLQVTTAAPTAAPTPSPSPTPKPTAKPTPKPTVAPSPYYLYAEKGSFTLAVYGRDAEGKYTQLVRLIRMAIGRGTMTPSGKFTLSTRLLWKTFNSSVYAQYGFQYRNGLYIHSPTYSSKNNTTMYTASYQAIGTPATSGCLRIPTGDAYWIYNNCPAGTILEIVSGSPRGLLPPTLVPIRVTGQDPTDPAFPPPTTAPTEPTSQSTDPTPSTDPSSPPTDPAPSTDPSSSNTDPAPSTAETIEILTSESSNETSAPG